MAKALPIDSWDRHPGRLIRCRTTHRYFREGRWTANPEEASVFPSERDALHACALNDLRNVELLRAPAPVVSAPRG